MSGGPSLRGAGLIVNNVLTRLATGLALAFVCTSVAWAQDTVSVVVVATTDVHGRAMHWDYVTDTEAPWGLTRVATVVDSLRRSLPGGVVLVDAGGLLQGDPFSTYFATESGLRGHPVIDAMNVLQYDAFAVGDHDFDFGFGTFSAIMDQATFPVLAANVYTAEVNARRALGDVNVVNRNGVSVGIAGFTTPGAMVWNRPQLAGRYVVRPIIAEAQQTMNDLVAAGAELKVVVVHSGMGGPSSYDPRGIGEENVGARFAELPVKPDLVVLGHSHRNVVNITVNGVHFMQPRPLARSVALARILLARPHESRPFQVLRITSEEIPLDGVPPHPGLTRRLSPSHNVVQTWANAPLAEVTERWSARFARTGDNPVIDLINEVQRRSVDAQLSATPAFDLRVSFGPGRVRRRDVLGLYPDESTPVSVRIDGGTLRNFLERSAEYFTTGQGGRATVDPNFRGRDFDIVSGLDYAIDVTRPVGSRIRQMVYDGRLVTTRDTFTLALSSFRRVGGGGYPMLARLPVVATRHERMRDLLLAEVESRRVLTSPPYSNVNWRIAPAEAVAALREVFGPRANARDRMVLRVLVTTALRGRIEPRTTSWSQGRAVGGALALKAWMDSLEASCNCAAIRLDAGDHLSGGFASNAFFGRPMVDVLNVIGYDAVAFGEGEFMWGADTLSERARQASYPWLAANLELTDRRAHPDWAEEWTMIERDGLRIAVIGVTAPSGVSTVPPANMTGLIFSDPAAAVTRILRTVRNTQPDYVVVLAHANATCDREACQGDLIDLAQQLEPNAVDLIVGDIHGDRVLSSIVNGIHVVQAGTDGAQIGLVDFVTLAGGRRTIRVAMQNEWLDGIRADPTLEDVLARYRVDAARIANRTVARLRVPLNPQPGGTSALGRLVADAYRNGARTQLAVVATSRVLTGLPAGTVTYGRLSQVQPLSQTVVRLTVTGDVILSMLEHALVDGTPGVHVAGMTVWYDPRRRVGDRVRRVRLSNNTQLRRNQTYSLATSDFLALGGAGFDMLAGVREVEGVDLFAADALANYLARLPQPVAMTSVTRFRLDR